MITRPTPRVNFELLERHINQRVLLVGADSTLKEAIPEILKGAAQEVDTAEAGRARVKAADGGTVVVELRDSHTPFETPYVEFRGVVTSPASLREESRTNFGSNLDMPAYNELCKLAAADYKDVFTKI